MGIPVLAQPAYKNRSKKSKVHYLRQERGVFVSMARQNLIVSLLTITTAIAVNTKVSCCGVHSIIMNTCVETRKGKIAVVEDLYIACIGVHIYPLTCTSDNIIIDVVI